jgi:hypothetical protein
MSSGSKPRQRSTKKWRYGSPRRTASADRSTEELIDQERHLEVNVELFDVAVVHDDLLAVHPRALDVPDRLACLRNACLQASSKLSAEVAVSSMILATDTIPLLHVDAGGGL